MFYVQNWERLFPQFSAAEIFKQQLKSIESSLQRYDASPKFKYDSYLRTEFGKIERLAVLIQDNLLTISQSPKDSQAQAFLFNGKSQQISNLKVGLKVFDHLKEIVKGKLKSTESQFDKNVASTNDPILNKIAFSARQINNSEKTKFSSDCLLTAQTVMAAFSDDLNEVQNKDVTILNQLRTENIAKVPFSQGMKQNASALFSEIRKDLRKNHHKLYFCYLQNSLTESQEQWQHPNHKTHAFVIEKTAADTFRIFQSYDGQYSLKSYLNAQLNENAGGYLPYEQFYPFMKSLLKLENSKVWSRESNENYKQCFGVDLGMLIGKQAGQGVINLSYLPYSLDQEVEAETEAEAETTPSISYPEISGQIKAFINKPRPIPIFVKDAGVGALFGSVASIATVTGACVLKIIFGF